MTIRAAQRCRWCGRPSAVAGGPWLRCTACGGVSCDTCREERRSAQAAWGEDDAAARCPCGGDELDRLDDG